MEWWGYLLITISACIGAFAIGCCTGEYLHKRECLKIGFDYNTARLRQIKKESEEPETEMDYPQGMG